MSKIVALLTRTAPRDLYDIHNMVTYGLFDECEREMLRKCAVLYSAIGTEQPPEKFELDHIGRISYQQIKRDLTPVLRRGEKFKLEVVQKEVRDYLYSTMIPTEDEVMFWKTFAKGTYCPERIFEDSQVLQNISKHPMALWKCKDKDL